MSKSDENIQNRTTYKINNSSFFLQSFDTIEKKLFIK